MDSGIVIIIILILLIIYHIYTQNKKEHLNELDWLTAARGLNISNAQGYNQPISLLSQMEKSSAFDINVYY